MQIVNTYENEYLFFCYKKKRNYYGIKLLISGLPQWVVTRLMFCLWWFINLIDLFIWTSDI